MLKRIALAFVFVLATSAFTVLPAGIANASQASAPKSGPSTKGCGWNWIAERPYLEGHGYWRWECKA